MVSAPFPNQHPASILSRPYGGAIRVAAAGTIHFNQPDSLPRANSGRRHSLVGDSGWLIQAVPQHRENDMNKTAVCASLAAMMLTGCAARRDGRDRRLQRGAEGRIDQADRDAEIREYTVAD
jgi:hypothetical protein